MMHLSFKINIAVFLKYKDKNIHLMVLKEYFNYEFKEK